MALRSEEIVGLANALAIGAQSGIVSREQASGVFKKYLRDNGLWQDIKVTEKNVKEKPITKG